MTESNKQYESYCWHIPENQREADHVYLQNLNSLSSTSSVTNIDLLRIFPKFVPVAALGCFLAKVEIYHKVLIDFGSVVEYDVYPGVGL